MFESIVSEYLQHTVCKGWSVISILEHVKSNFELCPDMFETLKTELYSVLKKKEITLRRKIKSSNAVQALEEHRINRMLIENMQDADVNKATASAVLKRKSSDPPEDKRKKIAVDNRDEKDYETTNLSSDTIERFFSEPSTSGVSNIFSSDNYMSRSLSFTQDLHDPVVPKQTLPCILNSGENFTDVWNKYLTKIDLHPMSVEHDCIVKTFQNDVLKSLCSKADWEQIRGKRLCLAEESLLKRLEPVFQTNENDKRTLLQNFARVWVALDETEITIFEQYALLVIHIFISELSSKRNIISHPSTTEAMWSTVISFVTGKAIRDGNMEYTWGEVELDSTATRKDGGRDILTLPKVATGHKGDGTGLSNDGHECFVLEISFAPQDQDSRRSLQVASRNERYDSYI
ncbi:hypothetical protein RclHR1_00080032 [Rhizophagus clarus]|uniref:Uncharacterized protein n=1 Tax=Rhizophagus clarus TaxID=94130 RepID=A0A2Z6SAQ6_9GLOM|nr:hypothetical protein RclHR1_00080032 [Rhizophagus clarus]GES89932.1 hypothetical protein RCL_jg23720.t1 [Rhizophagus clarus]